MISNDIKNLINISEGIIKDATADKINKTIDLASDTITRPVNFIAEKIKENKGKFAISALATGLVASPKFRNTVINATKGTYNFIKRGLNNEQPS